jgi:hypothetical protein
MQCAAAAAAAAAASAVVQHYNVHFVHFEAVQQLHSWWSDKMSYQCTQCAAAWS